MHTIELRGAKTHNLKNVSLDLEPGTFVVLCGRSGSGKSALAISTLYAEGQRRYVESFSAYARQFLERMARPPVDKLDPIAASIAVDRQGATRTSRSSVGTMTEIADYAKSLWASRAELHCAQCNAIVKRDHPQDIADSLLQQFRDARAVVSFAKQVDSLASYLTLRDHLTSEGFLRVLVDGQALPSAEVSPSRIFGADWAGAADTAKGPTAAKAGAKTRKKTKPESSAARQFHVVADRFVVNEENRARIVEALESAYRQGNRKLRVTLQTSSGVIEKNYSRALHCGACDIDYLDASEGNFSFNSPLGACETCRGFGRVIGVDWNKVLPDWNKTLAENAIAPWAGPSRTWERNYLKKNANAAKIPMDVPLKSFSEAELHWLKFGDGRGWNKGFPGIREWFTWLESKAYKMHVRVLLSRYRSYDTCADCAGSRFKKSTSLYRIENRSIADFLSYNADEADAFVASLRKDNQRYDVVLDELSVRIQTLRRVGLGYLAFDRSARTLSGGEAQRVALTTALSASLSGSMIVLDEPTVGLHPSDVPALIAIVRELTARGNLVVAIEHDHDFLLAADRVLELGPDSGARGGAVVFDGTPDALLRAETHTGRALRAANDMPQHHPTPRGIFRVQGLTGNNLKDISLEIPIGVLTCVTGVSGSGKSTAVGETLVPIARRAAGIESPDPLPYRRADASPFTDVVYVDQAPLGRTSRGNAATYTGLWDVLRARLAATALAKSRGYTNAQFSFNVEGGRCETCAGDGAETVEMQFMADVTFLCPDCGGKRFVGEVLDVEYLDANAADWLELTFDEAHARIEQEARKQSRDALASKLAPVCDVGLGYLRLGQALNALSDGEAQRLRLAEALMHAEPGALVVLDEPSSGLHHADIAPLVGIMRKLVDRGDTVVVVEHEMAIVRVADHVIDIGPHAGARGGQVIFAGSPSALAKLAETGTASETARSLSRNHAQRERRARSQEPNNARDVIHVAGARENNLKNLEHDIPLGKLVAVTGPSGSGKSTFAFDVVFAEGQRRYMETLSPYARQYLPQLPRPQVDQVQGIPPTVALEQRITRGGANSTVATITEVAHYLRVAFARAGQAHCTTCNVPISARAPNQIAEDIAARFGAKAEVRVLAPVVRGRKGHHRDVLDGLYERGIREVWVDGKARALEAGLSLARFVEHEVDAVLGSFRAHEAGLETAIRNAARECDGNVRIEHKDERVLYSTKRACSKCGEGFPELDPRFFSFNTQQGRCATCEGRGMVVRSVGRGKNLREDTFRCDECHGTRLSPLARSVTLDGQSFDRLMALTVADADKQLAEIALSARETLIASTPLAEARKRLAFLREVGLHYLSLDRSADTLSGGETQRVRLAAQLGSGLTGLLYVLDEPTIGLHPRDTDKLLSALRSLVDKGNSVLVVEHDTEMIRHADYVIDIGPQGGKLGGYVVAAGTPNEVAVVTESATGRSLRAPLTLKVAHDDSAPSRQASNPGDRPNNTKKPAKSETKPIVSRQARNPMDVPSGPVLRLSGATLHNLRGVEVALPLGKLIAVTGVSGSGKSTLVRRVLLPAVSEMLGGSAATSAGARFYKTITGVEHLKRATVVDQSPIGRTPRSVPATYVGIWDELRKLFAATPEARARGFDASRFSFNVAHDGRCPTCQGNGSLTVEMSFLPDVYVPCETCRGMRFTNETLLPRLHGYSAGDLLRMEIKDAKTALAAVPKVHRALALLDELGLGYLELGQPSHTLSGGEAQRVKLVAELAKIDPLRTDTTKTLYVLDEPTTGLHRSDVQKLIQVLEKFVARGDTVVVVEHNLDLIARSDWVVDLGPEGGLGGGEIVFQGPPAQLLRAEKSITGACLRQELEKNQAQGSKTHAESFCAQALA